VLFADIVGFTPRLSGYPRRMWSRCWIASFARWDQPAAELGVEKIKTIGDAYMVASGIPLPREDHAQAIAELAFQMGPEITRLAGDSRLELEVRIGIDTGPVVASVIGRAKFIYDLWGDRQHRKSDGIARHARRHPSHRTDVPISARAIRAAPARHDRDQEQGSWLPTCSSGAAATPRTPCGANRKLKSRARTTSAEPTNAA
jgi:class 3 adenylate cyclase